MWDDDSTMKRFEVWGLGVSTLGLIAATVHLVTRVDSVEKRVDSLGGQVAHLDDAVQTLRQTDAQVEAVHELEDFRYQTFVDLFRSEMEEMKGIITEALQRIDANTEFRENRQGVEDFALHLFGGRVGRWATIATVTALLGAIGLSNPDIQRLINQLFNGG